MLNALAIRRALDNLISNAVRYGSKAEVSVMLSDESLRVRVEERRPALRQPIHMRRLHLWMSAQRSHPIVQVVDNDQDDVGSRRARRLFLVCWRAGDPRERESGRPPGQGSGSLCHLLTSHPRSRPAAVPRHLPGPSFARWLPCCRPDDCDRVPGRSRSTLASANHPAGSLGTLVVGDLPPGEPPSLHRQGPDHGESFAGRRRRAQIVNGFVREIEPTNRPSGARLTAPTCFFISRVRHPQPILSRRRKPLPAARRSAKPNE